MIHLNDIRHWSAARLSQTVFYVLVALIAVLFALFYGIGYDTPYDENPDYNAPMLTGVLVAFMLLLLVVAVLVTVVTGICSLYRYRRRHRMVNGIAVHRIVTGVAAGTALLMAGTFLCAPVQAIKVNGQPYADGLWLRMAEMFVDTSLCLLAMAVVAMGVGYVMRVRRHGRCAKREGGEPC